MPIAQISLATGSSPSKLGPEGQTRLINGYVEEVGEGKHRFAIYAHSGLSLFATLSAGGEMRGMQETDAGTLVVAGRLVYLLDSGGGEKILGGIPSDGPVTMATNRKLPGGQTGIAAGGLAYLVENGVLTKIDDPDLPPVVSVTEVDGYLVWSTADDRLVSSGIDDGGAYDGLDFTETEGDRDKLLRVASKRREIWALGSRSIEIYTPNGEAIGFPFTRITFLDIGCLSGASVANVADTLTWIDDEGRAVMANGYAAQRISNHAVERAISEVADPSTIRGFSYHENGHQYYLITCDLWTWQYDVLTNKWGERQSYGKPCWVGAAHCMAGTRRLIGGTDGKVYVLDADLTDEAGQPIILTVNLPVVHGYPNRARFNRLFADLVTGVGLNTTAPENRDPQIMMKYSDDGGRTWSNERWRSLGKIGEYLTTVDWTRCGTFGRQGRIIQLSVSAAVAKGILAISADVQQLRP